MTLHEINLCLDDLLFLGQKFTMQCVTLLKVPQIHSIHGFPYLEIQITRGKAVLTFLKFNILPFSLPVPCITVSPKIH